MERTVAVGDGANDLGMITTAGLGVAFCAKPIVVERADAAVHVRDLTAVLDLLVEPAPDPPIPILSRARTCSASARRCSGWTANGASQRGAVTISVRWAPERRAPTRDPEP